MHCFVKKVYLHGSRRLMNLEGREKKDATLKGECTAKSFFSYIIFESQSRLVKQMEIEISSHYDKNSADNVGDN